MYHQLIHILEQEVEIYHFQAIKLKQHIYSFFSFFL